jgi:hypothetical protein
MTAPTAKCASRIAAGVPQIADHSLQTVKLAESGHIQTSRKQKPGRIGRGFAFFELQHQAAASAFRFRRHQRPSRLFCSQCFQPAEVVSIWYGTFAPKTPRPKSWQHSAAASMRGCPLPRSEPALSKAAEHRCR